jgi:hypothetical protein
MISASHPDDTTKPSRINRRRKKRWKNGLTNFYQASMLISLSQKTKARDSHPDNGHNRPLSTVVFLRSSKTQAVLRRLYPVMVGCIGQTLKQGLAGSVTGSANPMQSATQRVAPKGGGLSPYNGVTAMRNKYAQTTAKSSQTKQSLFSVYHNQNLIAFNVPGVLAFRLKQRKPTAILKFSRMGGAA